jgi:hypothetical protein
MMNVLHYRYFFIGLFFYNMPYADQRFPASHIFL